jgi:beta-glucosidase/6-phospho-beta-glucosidase/beta-galactosidase
MRQIRFKSFLMGGFECSTHRDHSGRRLDLIDSTKHDLFAEADYARLVEHGMLTARDGIRWHLIEEEPYRYDFSSLDSQIAGAKNTGIEIIWDYFHYGYPDDLDIFSPDFEERFSAFSTAVTKYLVEHLGDGIAACPVNEISFFSWIAADRGLFHPRRRGGGDILKRILIEAGRCSVEKIREVDPTARIMFTDPAIHVVPKDTTLTARRAAEAYRRAQFHAYDALAATADFEPIDVIGLNYYFHNQWRHPSRRKIPRGHKEYRPFSDILAEYYERYQRPILVAETGIEDEDRPSWFHYVCDEVLRAIGKGIPVLGICIYPICNHPGWADDRHCHNGLYDYPDENGRRVAYQPLLEAINERLPALQAAHARAIMQNRSSTGIPITSI